MDNDQEQIFHPRSESSYKPFPSIVNIQLIINRPKVSNSLILEGDLPQTKVLAINSTSTIRSIKRNHFQREYIQGKNIRFIYLGHQLSDSQALQECLTCHFNDDNEYPSFYSIHVHISDSTPSRRQIDNSDSVDLKFMTNLFLIAFLILLAVSWHFRLFYSIYFTSFTSIILYIFTGAYLYIIHSFFNTTISRIYTFCTSFSHQSEL